MTSNRLSKIRRKTGNPKVCYPPPPESAPQPPAPPSPPPEWPPPYINARLDITYGDETITKTFTLSPQSQDYPIDYNGYSNDGNAYASTQILQENTQFKINPYTTYCYGQQYYMTYNGPITDISQNGFSVQISNWNYKYPSEAQISLTLAYPSGA